MRLASRFPLKASNDGASNGVDPRENESAEVIDLASRTGFPAVTERKTSGDGLGLAAGVAIVFGLGTVTWWSMNAAQVEQPEPIGNAQVAAPAPAAK
ncbi:MAG: hypothetical protein AAFQ34_12325 [Pseudomonadota bacterium]